MTPQAEESFEVNIESMFARLVKRINNLYWLGGAMLMLTLTCVLLAVNSANSRDGEVLDLARQTHELTERVLRSRNELALTQARYQAIKGVLKDSSSRAALLDIQRSLDSYAREITDEKTGTLMTADEVQRGGCARLASIGYTCEP